MTACRIDKHLGARIATARDEQHVGLADLASALEITDQELLAREQGLVRIRASELARLAFHLDLPIRWFYEGLPGQALFDERTR
ncbi:MAG: hypothetical protein AAFO74_05055 [Pseudomonadota bacterium]